MKILTIQKWGNSQGVRIPKDILESCGLEIGDNLQLEINNDQLVIKAEKKRQRRSKYKLENLLNKIPEGFEKQECEWGDACGKESW